MQKKNILIKTLAVVLISIATFGIIINIIHFIEIRKTEVVNFDHINQINLFKDTLKRTKIIINKIDINNYVGNMSTEDLSTFNINIKTCLNKLESAAILNYKGEKLLTIKDKYILYMDSQKNECTIHLQNLDIMEKYDSSMVSIKNLMIPQILINIISRGPVIEQYWKNYQYFIDDYPSQFFQTNLDIMLLGGFYNAQAAQLEFMANWFNKQIGGDINE